MFDVKNQLKSMAVSCWCLIKKRLILLRRRLRRRRNKTKITTNLLKKSLKNLFGLQRPQTSSCFISLYFNRTIFKNVAPGMYTDCKRFHLISSFSSRHNFSSRPNFPNSYRSIFRYLFAFHLNLLVPGARSWSAPQWNLLHGFETTWPILYAFGDFFSLWRWRR